MAVIVNDMSEVNIDALEVAQTRTLEVGKDRLVELSNGCICCTLREDLLIEVGRLADEGRFDYLLIESSGISEPLPVAETFAFRDSEGRLLLPQARLDTLVTVVDGPNFLADYRDAASLEERGARTEATDTRNLSDVMVEQVEFANVILLNKIDLLEDEEIARLEATLHALNPRARILHTRFAQTAVGNVLKTGLFRMEEAEIAPGWMRKLRGEETSEAEEFGISNFVYYSRIPFHPERLWAFFENELGSVLRSKGFFWLASRYDSACVWSQAGCSARFESPFAWLAVLPKEQWQSMDPESLERMKTDWHPLHGDRRQELVFIGVDMDQLALRKSLGSCLLTMAELREGPEAWAKLNDPFPPFSS